MALWRLYPVAAPTDPRWLDHWIWQEVIVEAGSAAEARLAAGALARERKPERLGNESPADRTGFDDEKLYWVQQLDPAEALASPVSGSIRRAVPLPADDKR
jgi:hypothetical protein